jgi:hypothetical protein
MCNNENILKEPANTPSPTIDMIGFYIISRFLVKRVLLMLIYKGGQITIFRFIRFQFISHLPRSSSVISVLRARLCTPHLD